MMAAFFPGAGKPHELTPSQRQGYMQHLGMVLYLRDRALLAYHWSKFQDGDIDNILNPPPLDDAALKRAKAYPKFIRAYGLPDDSRITPEAAREFMAALKRKRNPIPRWALNIAPLAEIKQEAGEI